MENRLLMFLLALAAGAAWMVEARAESVARDNALGSGLRAMWLESQSPPEIPMPWLRDAADAAPPSAAELRRSALPRGANLTQGGEAANVSLGNWRVARYGLTGADGQTAAWRGGLGFESRDWRLAGSYARVRLGETAPRDETLRMALAYRVSDAQISAGWSHARIDNEAQAAAQSAWRLGYAQRVGEGQVRADLAWAGDVSGPNGANALARAGSARSLTVGYEFGLSEQAALFAFYTRLSNDPAARQGVLLDADTAALGAARSGVGLSLRYAF